jgi:hypothetical protein
MTPVHDDLLDELAANANYIGDVVDGVAEGALELRPSPDEWSVAEIIGHVRASDAIWTQRILVALVNDGARMPDVDERGLQDLLGNAGLTLIDQTSSLIFGRAELVGALRTIDDRDWSRIVRHANRGEMAVIDCVDVMLRHEREHVEHIRALVGDLTTSFDAEADEDQQPDQ